jgi:DNA-binding response OmpR family regulator
MPEKSALLVEDSVEVRRVIREILWNENYKVKSAADGIQAWEIVNNEPFDLIVSDLGLPGMSGEELLRNMRKKAITTPVILTAGVDPKIGERDGELPTNCRILKKPFEVKELRKLIFALTPGK